MKRPYYVSTPRNVFGEHIKCVPYEIRAVHTGKDSHGEDMDYDRISSKKRELNDKHEVMLAYAMHI